jgi:hypothetical protein
VSGRTNANFIVITNRVYCREERSRPAPYPVDPDPLVRVIALI